MLLGKALSDFSKYVYEIDEKSINQGNLTVCWHLDASQVMAGTSRKGECITSGYPLQDYQVWPSDHKKKSFRKYGTKYKYRANLSNSFERICRKFFLSEFVKFFLIKLKSIFILSEFFLKKKGFRSRKLFFFFFFFLDNVQYILFNVQYILFDQTEKYFYT